jgi:hypothetical protein
VSRVDIGAEELPCYVRQVDIPCRAPYHCFGIGIIITEIDQISRAINIPVSGNGYTDPSSLFMIALPVVVMPMECPAKKNAP